MAEWLKVSQISQRDTDVSRKEIGHRSVDDYATHKWKNYFVFQDVQIDHLIILWETREG